MASRKCPVCGASVNTENLPRHLTSVHPRDATYEMVREAKQAETQTPPPTKPRTRSLRTRPSWKVPAAALVIFLVVGGAYVVATSTVNPYSPYNANTPVMDMCINLQHTGLVRHDHVHLTITISGQAYPLPPDIGINTQCMRPLHTHTPSQDTIHVESPVAHEFTLRDFFTVWGQPFSSQQILSYSAGGSHVITMTVDGVTSTQFENLVLQNGQDIAIGYT